MNNLEWEGLLDSVITVAQAQAKKNEKIKLAQTLLLEKGYDSVINRIYIDNDVDFYYLHFANGLAYQTIVQVKCILLINSPIELIGQFCVDMGIATVREARL